MPDTVKYTSFILYLILIIFLLFLLRQAPEVGYVHDLWNSHVAYLIHQGVEPFMIKERLGHKDIKITLNTYGHLYPNEQKKLAEMLNTKK